MDVIISHVPEHTARAQMAHDILNLWRTVPGVSVSMRVPRQVTEPVDYQRQRRIEADSLAEGSIYVLSDDDCFPRADNLNEWLLMSLAIMAVHPQYGILCPMPENEIIHEWTPENYKTANDDDVMEHVSVGHIRFTRKGIVKDWPPMNGPGYDMLHCEAVRRAGYRVGFFRNLKLHHAGHGASTVWTA